MKQKEWSAGHYTKSARALERDIYPAIGKLPVANITPAIVAKAIEDINKRDVLETATRILQHLNGVFRYAQAKGHCRDNPAGPAREILPRKKDNGRMPALLDWVSLGDVLRRAEMARLSPSVRMAHRLCAFSSARIGNIVNAEWREFHPLCPLFANARLDPDAARFRVCGSAFRFVHQADQRGLVQREGIFLDGQHVHQRDGVTGKRKREVIPGQQRNRAVVFLPLEYADMPLPTARRLGVCPGQAKQSGQRIGNQFPRRLPLFQFAKINSHPAHIVAFVARYKGSCKQITFGGQDMRRHHTIALATVAYRAGSRARLVASYLSGCRFCH